MEVIERTQSPLTSRPDYAAIKAKQQATWASGDFGIIGTTLSIVGESLCEAADICAGERVLDVAAGNGNATLAAARRFADVTSTDYVPHLLEQGRVRAGAERLPVAFEVADAENLPYADGSFDAVLSTFGAMFAPDQARTAAELARVTRPGGRIGLANWTPEGFLGDLFRLMGSSCRRPPASCRRSNGVARRISPSSSAQARAKFRARGATSCSATARPSTGSRCSAAITGRRTRHSRRCRRRARANCTSR